MPKPFNVAAERNHFALPPTTRQQIQALMLDLDLAPRDVLVVAVAQLWQRECGEPERDLVAEVDALRARMDALAKSCG